MRSLFLAACLATVSLVPAQADIAWKTAAIAPGSSIVLKNSDGQVFTHVRRTANAGVVRFDTYAGKSERGNYVGSYLTNPRGEVLRTIAADGSETDYKPHQCNRSLGKCTYIIETPDGKKVVRTRITELVGGGVKFTEYERKRALRTGFVALDEKGSVAGGWKVDHTTGARIETKRLSVQYQ